VADVVDDPVFPDRVSINGGPMTPCRVMAVEVTTAPTGKPRAPRPDFNAVYDSVNQYRIRYDLPPADPFKVAPGALDAAIRGAVAYEQDVSLRQALLAVLDLHQPMSNKGWAPGRSEVRDVCQQCSPGEDDRYDRPWPCSTVRAIAEKLGVEVDSCAGN
jgi:hypothetical protein